MRNKFLLLSFVSVICFYSSGTLANSMDVTRRINPGRMAFEDVRWPAFKHAWYVLNDSTEQDADYFAIKE